MLLIRLAFSCVVPYDFRGYLGGSVLELFSSSICSRVVLDFEACTWLRTCNRSILIRSLRREFEELCSRAVFVPDGVSNVCLLESSSPIVLDFEPVSESNFPTSLQMS